MTKTELLNKLLGLIRAEQSKELNKMHSCIENSDMTEFERSFGKFQGIDLVKEIVWRMKIDLIGKEED